MNSVEEAEVERTEEHTAEEDIPAPGRPAAEGNLAADIPEVDKRPFRMTPADNLAAEERRPVVAAGCSNSLSMRRI